MSAHSYKYNCINCGSPIPQLLQQFNNFVKPAHCTKCNKIVDKYLEFEPAIIAMDILLMSQKAYRHVIYNRAWEFHWNILIFVTDSLALWRKQHYSSADFEHDEFLDIKRITYHCWKNVLDFAMTILCLLLLSFGHKIQAVSKLGVRKYVSQLFRAVSLAYFSKVFLLLPTTIWPETDAYYIIVLGHYIFALTHIYAILASVSKLESLLVVLPAYCIKEFLKNCMFQNEN